MASPQGSDGAAGSPAAPLRTAQALADALTPGQVGCLRAGIYERGLRLNHGGTSVAPLVLRSYPGERAQITGRLYVPPGSNYITIADLDLNGSHQPNNGLLPSPTVDASHTIFQSDDITNEHTTICFDLGNKDFGVAESTSILDNNIHDCGLLPADNHQHGIYVEDAIDTRIIGNIIAHNADRGIQLYPYSEGAIIEDNAIVENGEGIIFSGA
ncbi:MAG TPA: right-handed parallel beta-helix repeat-containing protein, partial [Solirubrobacteraceae bacterium]